MDADERDVYYYMKSNGRDYIPAREICKRVGGRRRFRFSPEWARPVLLRMAERGILEADQEGRYRLKPIPKVDTTGKQWASKTIIELLKKRGKPVDNLMTSVDEDEYYDGL